MTKLYECRNKRGALLTIDPWKSKWGWDEVVEHDVVTLGVELPEDRMPDIDYDYDRADTQYVLAWFVEKHPGVVMRTARAMFDEHDAIALEWYQVYTNCRDAVGQEEDA